MEPRARLGKNRGAQSFDDQTLDQFLFSYGDDRRHQVETRRVLDELVTDFITELCFETHRGAYAAGRQKIKLDDVKFACRKSSQYLGKIDEVFGKKDNIEKIRKMADVTTDQLVKSAKGIVEELGDADDLKDIDILMKDADGKSTSGKSAKGKGKSYAKR